MWWLVGLVVVVVFIVWLNSILTMPDFAREPCSQPKCDGKVQWLRGRDAGSTGEAMFWCKKCGHKEHRGGWASELIMENWSEK